MQSVYPQTITEAYCIDRPQQRNRNSQLKFNLLMSYGATEPCPNKAPTPPKANAKNNKVNSEIRPYPLDGT